MRHSAAHLMAAAILKLFPTAKLGVGPAIENGFYYDVDLETPISANDLTKIETKMRTIAAQNLSYERKELNFEEAKALFGKYHQKYKLELIDDIEKKGTTKIGDEEYVKTSEEMPTTVSVYETGTFVDLCQGPHVDTTANLGVFKLMSVAGAYWRGNEKNPMLQRIYGVLFATQEDLDAYLTMLEEAEKRDHRKIGKEQELFFFDELAGKGLPIWLPNGTIIRDEIQNLAVEKERAYGYERISSPLLGKEELYLTSGHLPYYKDDTYPAMVMDDGTYYLKPMNCPHHHLIYRSKPRSYRDLPIRLAEYGMCHRNELSGTLAGLLRVREMSMNDAHIYCRRDQIKDEFKKVIQMTQEYFTLFGLTDYWFRLSKWDANNLDKYINQPDNWDFAEGVLREVLQELNVTFVEADNEAAFYGPKVDAQFKSVIGRTETMSTIQLDFAAKDRFNLSYTSSEGTDANDVFVIHRAPLSTHERFTAFLIEHYAGVWPTWLAPVQVALLPVGDAHVEACETLAKEMREQGIRAKIDIAHETVGYKIRRAETQKIPYMIVIGDREVGQPTIPVRARGTKDTVPYTQEEFITKITQEIKQRSR